MNNSRKSSSYSSAAFGAIDAIVGISMVAVLVSLIALHTSQRSRARLASAAASAASELGVEKKRVELLVAEKARLDRDLRVLTTQLDDLKHEKTRLEELRRRFARQLNTTTSEMTRLVEQLATVSGRLGGDILTEPTVEHLVADARKSVEVLKNDKTKLEATQEELQAMVVRMVETQTSLRRKVEELVRRVSALSEANRQLTEGTRKKLPRKIIIPIPMHAKGRGLLFKPGSAQIQPQFKRVLGRYVAKAKDALQANDIESIQVEGHTDDQPLRGRSKKMYVDNWGLAAARAASMVRYLEDEGIPSKLLSAVSYAEHRPKVLGSSKRARSTNRRIELVLLRSSADN